MIMKYCMIPRLGKEASVISLGCEGFIELDQEKFDVLLDHALEKGINFIDMYTPNPSFRAHMKNAIKGRREQIILQGHIGSIWENGDYLRTRDLEKVKKGFDDLLEELGTDHLDIGMIHYVDEMSDLEKVFGSPLFDYVKELKKAGRIKAIGMSSHNPAVALKAVQNDWIDVLMFSINMAYDMAPATENIDELFEKKTYENELSTEPLRKELYALCEQKGVAIDVMKAFGGGDLLRADYSPLGVAFTEAMCLHYALSRPGVVAVMAGFHSPDQIDTLCQALDASEEEKDFASVLAKVDNVSLSGHCVYCSHCQPCTVGIQIAQVNKFSALAKVQGEIPETVREHYKALDHHAGECIECGACMKRCPFGVDIIAKMKEAEEIFGY